MPASEVVVVTGASAGVGRAVARAYARRGARIALFARGAGGLAAAADEVRELGGTALPRPVDVAEHDQLDRAAGEAEANLGPIDVWINAAFSTVFGTFDELSPEEYARATQVTYLGFVHGTMAALRRMRPRDRGVVVQVGSALAYRGVPLQTVYCGAKHAIQGFHESLRCELLHERSGVQVTMVQLPGLNTPQFSWARSKLPHHPQPVPPIYQPELAADAVLRAADRPRRREYWVGGSTVGTLLANSVAPGLLDRYLARTGFSSQQNSDVDDSARVDNLFEPADAAEGRDFGAHGAFGATAHSRSPQWWVARNQALLALGGAILAGVGAVLARSRR
ncbi:MAG: SDR family oxidoreductase [Saccharopolyspora sp.]|uniref:SDR family oxidoreductase n=1 Tax=Saccharopolyspora sp. TaxID=33915 RepID=UPI0025F35AF1|nr:SDR family oxidoreductase [Saccharopolyspora sp.]MBQ6644253.1 SDR family oxidoreductase [Saccharopolyspora sp.]